MAQRITFIAALLLVLTANLGYAQVPPENPAKKQQEERDRLIREAEQRKQQEERERLENEAAQRKQQMERDSLLKLEAERLEAENRRIQQAISRHPSEPEMIFVQGGTFWMGCTAEQGNDCYSGEYPVHQVTLSSFNIGKYPVTQGQWRALMGTTVRQQPDSDDELRMPHGVGDNFPMYNVNWNEAQEFIRRLNEATGKHYRLPTEAEWEFAARGGSKSRGYKYSGSNNMNDVAWYGDNSDNRAHPVGSKFPNELGIYDMSGNVLEWCNDWVEPYTASPKHNPTGPKNQLPTICETEIRGSGRRTSWVRKCTTFGRVLRGGGWRFNAEASRVTNRNNLEPDRRYNFVGFRLVHP